MLGVSSVGAMNDGDSLLLERRTDNVRIAVMEANFFNHTEDCKRDRADTNRRLGRIEKGIVAVISSILIGGATVIGILLRIALHLG